MKRRLPVHVAVVLIPAIVVTIGLIATAVLAASAPAEVAVHWNIVGDPDGYAPPWAVVVGVAIGGIGLILLFTTILLLARAAPDAPSFTEKFLVAVATGTTALIAAGGIWTLAAPQGVEARPGVDGGFAIAFAAALVVAVVTWFLMPRAVSRRRTDPDPAPAIPLGATERAVWVGTARMARGAIIGIGAGTLALLALVAFAVFTTDGGAWPVLIVPAGIGVFLFGLSSYAVRIDDGGLQVRALLGIPFWRISPQRVASAGVVDVAPLVDFGGWGVRLGRGARTGVITRAGEALQVRRRDGRALVVTVDDAATAASLMSAVAARAAT